MGMIIENPDDVARLPWVQAIQPIGAPYRERLSKYSDLVVWHVNVGLKKWPIPSDLALRWEDNHANNSETWRKRPLASGEDSGCEYSCGEVELAARLRKAGYHAQWVSEWSNYPHVKCWKKYCVKRSELQHQRPELYRFDQKLREESATKGIDLGTRGGHPDVAAWRSESAEFVYLEYKGPEDKINEKQDKWARAILSQEFTWLPYLAVKGNFLL